MTFTPDDFFRAGPFAVVGASSDRSKFGNKVLRAYLEAGMTAYPVNPRGGEIEGVEAFTSLADLPETVQGVSIITPPSVTERVVEEAAAHGAKAVWMQPGAESLDAIRKARELGLEVLAGGPCVLVDLPRFKG